MAFQTEYEFELPKGYVDEHGDLHKRGVMRLATAADEILPMRDSRVQSNPGYLTIILLARVITKLGDLKAIDTKVIEKLFTADFAYLQDFYQRVNESESARFKTVCPKCQHEFEAEINFSGEPEGE
ncbi:phage tail assembly protein [Pelotomaculum terephthalicicum JT]|uniref:phage tail assembly protein n=1 Tax=Pelotomaculum terephthalicicum TaxID=206393 RepID=UPI001F04BE75|nr:phage tail assembly protein [Pelotomaculum terephthalicicum]MCG9968452.1 phage tail assembly protein [Pelotomaculum terephthalicicum JT]